MATWIYYIHFYESWYPAEIRADKRRTFWGSEHTMTHVGKILAELGIKLRVDSSPTFKPNVERAFQNAQNSFPYYFANTEINTMEQVQENSKNIIKFITKDMTMSWKKRHASFLQILI